MPRIYVASKRQEDSSERLDSQEYENRPGLGRKSFTSIKIVKVLKLTNLWFKTEPLLWFES